MENLDDWKPLREAPKDGRQLLVRARHGPAYDYQVRHWSVDAGAWVSIGEVEFPDAAQLEESTMEFCLLPYAIMLD